MAPHFPSLSRSLTAYPQDACTSTDGSTSSSYYILLAGQAVRGFGGTCLGTLMLAYIDENVTQRTSPFYIGMYASGFLRLSNHAAM